MGKSSIKEFLKPDWRKIVVFAAFFFLGIFFGALLYNSESTLSIFGTIIFNLPSFLGGYFIEQPSDFTIVIIYLINFLFYYIISCLIVFIYDMVKKK